MKKHALSLAAALFIASAGAALGGEETINGKPMSLDHDIIREMNGDDTFMPKTQILKLTQVGNDLHGSLWMAPYDQDRGKAHNEKKDVIRISDLDDQNHYMGIMAAVSTRRVAGSKRRVVVGDFNFGGHEGIKTFLTELTDDGAFKISGNVRTLSTEIPGSSKALTDIRGGLFIDGERHESFVVGFLNDEKRSNTFNDGNNGGKDSDVDFMILDGRKLNDESFKGDPSTFAISEWYDAHDCPSDSQFPVARVVAGDFDGDGIASEIAYVYTPKNEGYTVEIYKVYRKKDGEVSLERMHAWSVGNIDLGIFHGSQHDTEPGCDIVAGDFDRDGHTELAVVVISSFDDTFDGPSLGPLMQTFKYVDGKWKSQHHQYNGIDFPGVTDTKVPGVLAVAGDFDGDGADDVAFVTAHDQATYLATATFDHIAGEAPMPIPKQKIYAGDIKVSRKYTPLASVASLAAGPTYAAAGEFGLYDEIYMTLLKSDGKTALYHLTDPLSDLQAKEMSVESDAKAAALMVSDLTGESMVLGLPDHIMELDARSYYTILPAVPYHIDYIRSNWQDKYDPPAPRTLQIITPPTSKVTYTKSESESEVKDTTFDTTTHFDWGVGGGFKFPVKAIGLNVGVEGGYKGSNDSINKKLSSETTSRSMKAESVAQNDDNTFYYYGTLHAWRYPIIGSLAETESLLREMFGDENNGADVPKNDPLKNVPIDPEQQKFYTVFHLEDVRDSYSDVGGDDRYQPDHDESNLFSYPNALKFSKSYQTRQKLLSPEKTFDSGSSRTHIISFESIKSEKDQEVETSNNGGSVKITGGLAIPASKEAIFSAEGNLSGGINYMVSNGTTFTSTSKGSTSYTVNVIQDNNAANTLFRVHSSAYVDAGGISTLGFAIDLRPNDSATRIAWADDGPYGKSPDPSLVLPDRVYYIQTIQNNQTVRTPMPQKSLAVATNLRGVRLYDRTVGEDPDVGTSYTLSTLVRGRKYTVVVPIYNASFKDTDYFNVQLGYMTHEHLNELEAAKRAPALDDAEIKPLGEVRTKLYGWMKDSDAHRGAVKFEDVLVDMPSGNYELCVRIVGSDGDIHRDWNLVEGSSEYDPCGNDWGHFKFAVIEEADLLDMKPEYYDPSDYDPTYVPSASTISTGDISAAAPTSEPKIDVMFEVEGQEPMTFDEFRRWLLERTDPVDVKIEVANTGDRLIRDAFAVVYEQLEGDRRRTLFDGDLTSLFPGKSVSRRFTVDPQKFLSRDIRAKIIGASISQTYGEPAEGGSSSSGSGGCAAGAAGMAAIALLVAATRRRK